MFRVAPALIGVAWLLTVAIPACAADSPNDPMRPDYATPAHSTPRAPHWYLSSTLISAERRIAVVNGRSVGVGDRIDGAQVLAILPYAVRLKHDDTVLTVYLVSRDVKHHENP